MTLQVRLKGDFLFAPDAGGAFKENLSLDADNTGGQVGIDRTRGRGARRQEPVGKSHARRRFRELAAAVSVRVDRRREAGGPGEGVGYDDGAPQPPRDLPVSINLATPDMLERAGFTSAQARRLVESRRNKPFRENADVIARGNISEAALRKVGDRIVLM